QDSSWHMRLSGQVRAARPPLVAEAARARIEVSDYQRTTVYETCDTDRRVLSHDGMLQLQSADDAEPRAGHLCGREAQRCRLRRAGPVSRAQHFLGSGPLPGAERSGGPARVGV